MTSPAARSTWVIIPAFNEARSVAAVVEALKGEGYHLVIVDDGSTDETAQIAAGLGVNVCRHRVNLGQGAAIQTGIEWALGRGASYFVTFDADGQHAAADIPKLVAPLMKGRADVALGSRFVSSGRAEGIPAGRRVVLWLAVRFTRLSTGLAVTDTHNGIRALNTSAARSIQITQNGMAHAGQILRQVKSQGLRWVEVPVAITYTPYSLAKGQRLWNIVAIIRESIMGIFRT